MRARIACSRIARDGAGRVSCARRGAIARAAVLGLGLALPAGAADWTVVPLETSGDVHAIGNSYAANHWVAGAGGFVARSNADRTTWTTLDPGTSADLYSIADLGAEVWMGGGAGVVRLNLYAAWIERDIPSQEDFRLFTRHGGQCAAVGPAGLMFRWVGGSWTEVATGVAVDLNGGAGIPTGPAWVVGDGGTILRSTDGDHWEPVASGTTADLHAVAELDLTTLYAVGAGGTILKSTDAGASWRALESGTTSTLRAVSIAKTDHEVILAAGLGGTVLRSTDAGATWRPLDVTTADLHAAEACSELEFFVAGAGGLLLRTTNGGGDGGATGVVAPGPRALVLRGPFPQPSRGRASLRVAAVPGGSIHADVYDLAGRRVLALPERRVAAGGEQEIPLDTSGLSSGVYLVRVRAGGGEATRHLVVAR